MGIHNAATIDQDWTWYANMVGAFYGGSDAHANLTLNVVDPNHISTQDLPNPWVIFDEYYVFNQNPTVVPGIKVLLNLEQTNAPYEWYHDYDGGRAWYTNGGSEIAVWSDENFLTNILGGIQYARGITYISQFFPSDFNHDTLIDCADINALTTEIAAGTHNLTYDLTGDGLVTIADRDAWLVLAGRKTCLPGDRTCWATQISMAWWTARI